MSQLMPLPLTVSCFNKIQIGFTFLVPAHLGSPGKRAVKRVCVLKLCFLHWFCYFQSRLLGPVAPGSVHFKRQLTQCHCHDNCRSCDMSAIGVLENGSVNHTHTHTPPFNGPFSGTTQVSRYQNGKTNLNFTEEQTVSDSGISWAICKSAPRSRQITTPATHHSFLHSGCPSCRPSNSVKALKAKSVNQRLKLIEHRATGP